MTGITIDNVQREVAPKAGNSDLWFLCSAHQIVVIHLHKVSRKYLKTVFKLQSGHIYYRNHYFQCSKGGSFKVGLAELWFFCAAPCLMMLSICVRFYQNI